MELTATHRNWQVRILTTTFVAYIGYYLTRKVFGIVKTSVAPALGVTLQEVAHLWTAFLVAYMVGQFVNGFVGRRIGPKLLILIGLGISIGCSVVFGVSNSYAMFMLFMILNGLVQASGWPGVVGGVAHWLAPKERGTIMGLWSSSYLVGNMAVKLLGAYILAAGGEEMGWRYTYFSMAALTLLIWLMVLVFQRDKPEDVGLAPIITEVEELDEAVVKEARSEHISMADYLRLIFSAPILLMGACYFCVKFLRYALDSWLPTFLDLQGMGKAAASSYSSIFDFAGIAGALVAGLLLDRVFKKQWVPVCLLMGIGCVLSYWMVLQFGTSPTAVAWLFGAVGFMLYGPDTIICGAAAVTVAGERNALAAAGIINGIGSIGPIVQEEVIGWIVDESNPVASLRHTNYLFLGIAGLFVTLLTIEYVLVRRRHAGAAG